MGCSKNLIDSERLIKRLESEGFSVSHDPKECTGEYVMVNTCGFIGDAKEESINLLLQLASLKEEGKIGRIAAMGCLTQRYLEDIKREIPEIDMIYGKFDWNSFIADVKKESASDIECDKPKEWERTLTTPPHSAYMKISEGCNRFCAFCAIPIITGRHHSRPIEEVVDETRALVAEGVKEFNVIAQDLSSYGLDIYGEHKLAELIDAMADVEGVEWIRLHYAYPADFPMDILDVMARRKNVCKYLDIALQHISDNQLKRMRRHIDKKSTLELLSEIRRRVPGIKIRTTLMVGFPGETEANFEELKEFVKTQRFDKMGAFAYSEEDDTYAALNYSDDVSENDKQRRLDTIMAIQEEISSELNSKMVGAHIRVLVDELEGEDAICRSEFDSPEVDHTYRVKDAKAKPGDFITIEILEAYPFDFVAKRIN